MISRKKALWLTILIAALAGTIIYLQIEPFYTPTALHSFHYKSNLPKLIAHKAILSEQSLLSPIGGLELDVRISKDGVPFIFHAEQLEALTNGKGIPEEKTWNELKRYSYFKNGGAKILSLEEVFNLVGSKKFLFLDIKDNHLSNSVLVNALIKLIYRYQLQETVVIESFNPIFLGRIRLAARDIMIMLDFTEDTAASGEETQAQFDRIPWILKQPFFQKQFRRILRPDLLGPRWNISQADIIKLNRQGYPLIAWTVDDPAIAKKLYSLGVYSIQSNRPLELLDALQIQTGALEDAGGTQSTPSKLVDVYSPRDVIKAIALAKKQKRSVTISGSKHSMGGQTLLDNTIHLNMLGFNQVEYDSHTKRVRAQAGATWKKVQAILNAQGRSVAVMQSDNIFTVGGSISVNAHGWQVGHAPLGATVHSMKVVTAQGKNLKVSSEEHPEFFRAIIGGYGQFAIILEAELETYPNTMLTQHHAIVPIEQFAKSFKEKVQNNPKVQLAYGRLSVDDNFLQEAGLFWFEQADTKEVQELIPERLIAAKRAIFRLSEQTAFGKKLRWSAEKQFAARNEGIAVSRNTAMNADIHVLWPLRANYRDILHEYFIPKQNLVPFVASLRKLVKTHEMNLLNVTIRDVRKDEISLLPFAQQDVFALVLLFSQKQNSSAEKEMHQFTMALIDEALHLGGTFYLPYRLHYTRAQLIKAYPMIKDWTVVKNRLDPEGIFSSQFFRNIERLIETKQ